MTRTQPRPNGRETMHQVIIHTAGRSEVYGTYATRDEAEQIAAGLRQVWWATATTIEVKGATR